MQKNNRLIYFLALLKIVIPYFLQSSYYGLQRDEFLYLEQGHHLAWGFMEVPPMLSFFAWITHLFGDGIFWVKLWPSLFGAATFIATGKIVQSLGGKSFAILLAFLPFIFGVYLRLFFLFQPNPPEVFFWTMIAFSVIRYIQTEKNKWLYVFGISIGLGMISKYSVAFFAISVLAGMLVTRQRKIFLNKHLYFAGLIAALIFLPTFLWEYNRHFPVMVHMRELQHTQLQYINPAGFLIDQLLMNLPCVFIWLAGLYFIMFIKEGIKYRLFAWAYLFLIVLLLVFHGKNYYSVGVYPTLFAFGACNLERFSAVRFKGLKIAFVLIPVLLGLLLVPLMLPTSKPESLSAYYIRWHLNKTGALKWEDLKNHALPQDFADMLGWDEIAEKVSNAYQSLDSNEKKKTIIFCDNYGEAGAVNFYKKKYGLPEAYSDNGSFLYWMPRTLHIENLILVTDDTEEMQHSFIKDFVSATAADSVTNKYAVEQGSLIIILKGANDAFNKMFKEKIDAKYAQFK